jgi:aminopeptidase-like protein
MPPLASVDGLLEDASIGEEIFALAAEIYPICRSITGDGVRATLDHLAAHIDLQVHEVPSGIRVFDGTVPREWNIRDAWIKDPAGRADRRLPQLQLARLELQPAGTR